MPVVAVFTAAVGVAVGAFATIQYQNYEASKSKTVQIIPKENVVLSPSGHPALKYGLPVRQRIRQFSGYVVGFDPATRNPMWVLEHLNKETANGNGDRKNSKFKEDAAIEPRFRSKLKDYAGSGYDRGHMTPAMDHKFSQERMDDTFSMSNMSPQVCFAAHVSPALALVCHCEHENVWFFVCLSPSFLFVEHE